MRAIILLLTLTASLSARSPRQLFEEYNERTTKYMQGGPEAKQHLAAAMAAFDELVPWLVSQENLPPGLDPLDFTSNVLAFHQTNEHVRSTLPLTRYALKGVADKCAVDADGYEQACQDVYGVLCSTLQQVGEAEEAAACIAEYNAPRPKERLFLSSAHIHRQLPQLRAQPWWQPEDMPFTFIPLLKQNFDAIRSEVQSVTAGPFSGWSLGLDLRLATNGEWDPRTAWESIILHAQGQWDSTNCALLPVTCSLLKSDTQLPALFPGKAQFMRLLAKQAAEATEVPTLGVKLYRVRANSGIKPHMGSPARIVCSLTITGPSDPAATLTVANETKEWREGEWLCFDDSFNHAVNNSHPSVERVVLAIVSLHPDLLPHRHEEF